MSFDLRRVSAHVFIFCRSSDRQIWWWRQEWSSDLHIIAIYYYYLNFFIQGTLSSKSDFQQAVFSKYYKSHNILRSLWQTNLNIIIYNKYSLQV